LEKKRSRRLYPTKVPRKFIKKKDRKIRNKPRIAKTRASLLFLMFSLCPLDVIKFSPAISI
jgi:hypothetical protein